MVGAGQIDGLGRQLTLRALSQQAGAATRDVGAVRHAIQVEQQGIHQEAAVERHLEQLTQEVEVDHRPDIFLAVDHRLEELLRVGVALAGQLRQLLRGERMADQQHQDRSAIAQHALGVVQTALLRVHGHEEQGDRLWQDQDVAAGRLVAVVGGILMHHHPTRQGDIHPVGRFAGIAKIDQIVPLDGAIRVEDFRPGRTVIRPNRCDRSDAGMQEM